MTFEAALNLLNSVIAAVAIFFALIALKVAKATLELEKEAMSSHRLEQRLKELDELALAVYELGLEASLAALSKAEEGAMPAARARFQVAYRAVTEELPVCKKLANEPDAAKVAFLSVHASAEIAVARHKLVEEDRESR